MNRYYKQQVIELQRNTMLHEAKTLAELIKGNEKFKMTKFPKLQEEYLHLIENGQHPKILFIGCSDARVVPDLIVDAQPGDMFTLRNIGNFVPPYSNDNEYHSTHSAIQYALSVLEVKDIVICGHSHCGACASLYEDLSKTPNLEHVHKWLDLGRDAQKHVVNTLGLNAPKEIMLRATEKISVKYQLENLLTYPGVSQRIKNKSLKIHGWYYQIEYGSIDVYDNEIGEFKSSY